MAGVGIELQRILKRNTFFSTLRAYTYAAALSAGPWIISIVAILAIEILKVTHSSFTVQASKFQVTAVYLIAISLIFSSFAQQSFTRYMADHVFHQRFEYVAPNYLAVMLIMTVSSGIFAFPLSFLFFHGESVLFRLLAPGIFVLLCNIWYSTCLLSGLKNYTLVLFAFLIGYGSAIFLGIHLRFMGAEGLLLGFFVGQFILLLSMILTVFFQYPSDRIIEFDIFTKERLFYSFIISSFFYNCAIWVDKFVFWYSPLTGQVAFGHMHVCVLYDIPMFLSYAAMIPGLAVFLMYIETDFVTFYDRYYTAITKGYTLSDIYDMRFHMIGAARRGIWAIMRIQTLCLILVYILGNTILKFLNVSPMRIPAKWGRQSC